LYQLIKRLFFHVSNRDFICESILHYYTYTMHLNDSLKNVININTVEALLS
jgi:hypothetical protein